MSQKKTLYLEGIELVLEWYDLAKKIRSGCFPNAQHLLIRYIQLCEELAAGKNKTAQQWLLKQVLKCLEETICDSLISSHWRYSCADYLYRPICSLAKIADGEQDKEQLKVLSRQAYQHCRYFLCSSPRYI